MQTELDDDTFGRIVDIVDEIYVSLDRNTDQDKLLVLICLQLAYKLEKFSGTLESLDKKLKNLKR